LLCLMRNFKSSCYLNLLINSSSLSTLAPINCPTYNMEDTTQCELITINCPTYNMEDTTQSPKGPFIKDVHSDGDGGGEGKPNVDDLGRGGVG